jgi:methyl-accepting chemotaxis protein
MRVFALCWIVFGSISIAVGITAFKFTTVHDNPEAASSVFTLTPVLALVMLSASILAGIALFAWLALDNATRIVGPCDRLGAALGKLANGDLGWTLSVRHGDALFGLADNANKASTNLAGRINRLRVTSQSLNAIEDHLIEEITGAGYCDRQTIKRLRMLKIHTSRLNAELGEFQVSQLPTAHPGKREPVAEAIDR